MIYGPYSSASPAPVGNGRSLPALPLGASHVSQPLQHQLTPLDSTTRPILGAFNTAVAQFP